MSVLNLANCVAARGSDAATRIALGRDQDHSMEIRITCTLR